MIGIIGGSGLYKMDDIEQVQEKLVETPFGKPSGPIVIGTMNKQAVAFLPRHGQQHNFLPGEINFRANIWALKSLGVHHVVSVSAVGSLDKDIHPGDLAVVGQYIDWTRGKRDGSFFGKGVIAHISMAVPVCPTLSKLVYEKADGIADKVHTGKTYACVEGPRFGTRAESHLLRSWGAQLVGMTNVPEAFLAREAQMCYSSIGVVTDFDCWMEDEDSHVSATKMLELYRENLKKVQKILKEIAVPSVRTTCPCRTSLQGGLLTPIASLPKETQRWVEVLAK
jgi:5'-methylthioadenosine phosphorylase